MLVLALESATELAGVALADDGGVLASVTVAGRRHSESLAPAVEFVCARSAVSLDRLDALCVDVGPGLFTGLRVGVSLAKALAFGLGLPVVAVGSLELLAAAAATWPADADGAGALLVPVVDARRALVFSARFRRADGASSAVVRVGDDRLLEPEVLAAEVGELVAAGQSVVALGDGARRYGQMLGAAGARVAGSLSNPDVGVLATMGVRGALAGTGRPAAEVTAHYLRPADVRINWEQRMTVRP